MPKLIAFAAVGYTGGTKEFRSTDPDLTMNGDDFLLSSALTITGVWDLYSDVNYTGDHISLNHDGGPDADGAYKDPADWQGIASFHVKSMTASD